MQSSQGAHALSSPTRGRGTTAAVFVYMSVAGWNPLCSSCHAAAQYSPRQADHINWLSCLGGERVMSVSTVFVFCLRWHRFLSEFPSRFDLRPPHPYGLCATFSSCLWAGDIKGDLGASPHNSLSECHPPAHSRHSSLTLPASDSAMAEASNQQWRFAPLDVPPQYRFEEWKWTHGHSRHLFIQSFGQIHLSLVLHQVCCFPPSGNTAGNT